MNSLRIAFIPGVIAGVITIFTSWFWIGFVFHKFQRSTPQTWRPESGRSHLISSIIQVLSCLAIAILYVMAARGNGGTLGEGLYGACWFALICWAALAAPVLLNQLIYVNLHPLFVLGLLLSWLTTTLVASCVSAWWLGVV
jgi:hypothetical protein